MYRVLYKNELLFDPYVEETAITDAKLTQEVNSSAYFDFTISPKHPLYDTVAEREGSVKLYYDAEKLFEGEITKIETDIYGCKSITCVSALDYLNDTCVRPYSTVKSEGLDLVPPSSVNGYFQWLIDQHNEHVLDASKAFTVGVNQGEYFTGGAFIYRSSESYSSTADEIQSNILDVFGGYLFLRYDGENAVLDLYSDVHEANTQIIDFGVNITDFAKTLDTDEQYTALIVQGGSPEFQNGGFEDGTFIEWASYARGNISSDQVHSGSYSAYFTEGGNYINDTGFYFKTGARYKSTIWVKNERDADITVTGAYQYETTSDGWKTKTVSGASLSVPNDGEWHEFTFDFLPDVQPQTRIRPVWSFGSLSVESNHRVYVDDADFTRLDGEDSVAEDPLDLSHIPDGVTSYDSDIVKKGDVLYSISYVQRYGYKEKVYSDDTITDEQKLLEEGIKQLRKLMAPVVTIDVKAVDLSLYIQGYTHLRIGEAVRVRSAVHDVDEYLMVSSIDLDLQDPGQTDYTLGTSYDTLTGQQSGYLKSLNAGINHSLDSVASLDQELKDQAVQIGGISDVADDAKEIADDANQTAQNAQNSADNALNKAEEVEDTVNGIQIIIDQIDADVEQAKQDAADAKADVAEAASKADAAAEKADAAAEKADSYQQQITDVTTTVNGVVQEVEGYTALIQGAVEDASGALSAATAAQADIDGFKTTVSQTYQTKSDAADAMEQEVLNRNSAIEQSAEGILQQVSESYVNNETGETLATKAELSQTASEITQSVSETYQVKGDYLTEGQAAEVYASKAELSTTADAITATVEEKFDDSLLVKEADGGIIDCGDTAGMPLAGLTVYGKTRQNLWVNPSGTNLGVTVTTNANGSMTLSGTSTGYSINSVESYVLRPGSTYTASIDGTLPSGASFRIRLYDLDEWVRDAFVRASGSATFTVPSDGSWTVVRFTVVVENGTEVSGTYRVMLNEGSEAQPWCPPGLNSVEDVTVHSGSNLFPDVADDFTDLTASMVTLEEDGWMYVHGDNTGNTNVWANFMTYQINGLEVGTKLWLLVEWKDNDGFNSFSCDARKYTNGQLFVSGDIIAISGDSGSKVVEVTVGRDASVCAVGLRTFKGYYPGDSFSARLRLSLYFTEEEANAGWVPYKHDATEIDLLGNKVSSLPDGTRDELVVDAGGNVVLRKNVIEHTQSSSTGLTPLGQAVNYRVGWDDEDMIPSNLTSSIDDPALLCDTLPVGSNNDSYSNGYGIHRRITGDKQVVMNREGMTNLTSWNTWLSSNPLTAFYPREETSLIPLGTVDLPDLPETNAHVWISTGTQGLDPDIHATWYGENASALKDFASKAELKVESDQIKAMVEETYSTKEEVSTTYATKSEVTQTANSIKSEVSEEYVSKDDASATYATKTSVSMVEQTVDSLTSTVSEVQTTATSALTKATTVEQTADGLEVRLTQAEKDVDTAQSTANNAAKTATNYLKFDSTGLCVGDMTSGTLGYNTLIKPTGLSIRNGTTELASFSANRVELGKGSSTSEIDFSNGALTIRGMNNYSVITQDSSSNTIYFYDGGDINIQPKSTLMLHQPCKDEVNYEIFGGRRLFYNSSGTTGNITLSESAANFDFIDIYFRNNDNLFDCTRVYSPNGKIVNLSNTTYKRSTDGVYMRNKAISISGTAVTVNSNFSGEGYALSNGSCWATYTNNVILIYAVWGFK